MNDNNIPNEDPGDPKKPSKLSQFLSFLARLPTAETDMLADMYPPNSSTDPTKAAVDAAPDVAPPPVVPAFVPEPDQPLRPHSFRPQVELISERLPRVLITPEAYKHMCLYVDIAAKEVGWMGSVSRLPDGDFLIEETFLLEQEVHETETELASEDIGKLAMSLIDSGEDGLEKVNKLRFWGHSHVHMGTFASGTDERTMDRFGREKMPWYVRGIFNKYGRGEFTIYLYERGMRINDAAWAVWDPDKKVIVMQDRKRFGSFTGLVEGVAGIVGTPVAIIPPALEPSPELRAKVETEFKAKVKERVMRFWRKPAQATEPAATATPAVSANPAAPAAEPNQGTKQ